MVNEFQRTKVHFNNPTPSLENMNPIIFSILNNRSLRIPQSYYINFVSGTYQLRIPRLIFFLIKDTTVMFNKFCPVHFEN